MTGRSVVDGIDFLVNHPLAWIIQQGSIPSRLLEGGQGRYFISLIKTIVKQIEKSIGKSQAVNRLIILLDSLSFASRHSSSGAEKLA